MVALLGIEDRWVWLAYLLCVISALLCVVYGLLTWNRGDEPVEQDDLQWMQEEQKAEEEF
ncbi:MAG: symporter small accessory protein [Planctomycetota bacterium]